MSSDSSKSDSKKTFFHLFLKLKGQKLSLTYEGAAGNTFFQLSSAANQKTFYCFRPQTVHLINDATCGSQTKTLFVFSSCKLYIAIGRRTAYTGLIVRVYEPFIYQYNVLHWVRKNEVNERCLKD